MRQTEQSYFRIQQKRSSQRKMKIVCKHSYNYAKEWNVHIWWYPFYFIFLFLFAKSNNLQAKYDVEMVKEKQITVLTTYSNVAVFFRMGKHQKHQYTGKTRCHQPNRDKRYTHNTDRTENRNRFSTQHTLPQLKSRTKKEKTHAEERRIEGKITINNGHRKMLCVSFAVLVSF